MSELMFDKDEVMGALHHVDTGEIGMAVDRISGIVELLITQFQIKNHERASDEAYLNALWAVDRGLTYLDEKIKAMDAGVADIYQKCLLAEYEA